MERVFKNYYYIIRGEYAVIFGAGIIGLMAAYACIHYGAVPILVDVLQKRLDYAKEHGIDLVFQSKDGDVEQYLKEVTAGKLPEAMIDCTGAPVILEQMQNYVCYGGRIALVGWPHSPVKINTVRLMQKEIDVYPSRNSNGKFPEAIEMIQAGEIPSKALISKIIRMNEVENTIQDMIQSPAEYLKVLVKIENQGQASK